jgi:DNA gyrase subunit B
MVDEKENTDQIPEKNEKKQDQIEDKDKKKDRVEETDKENQYKTVPNKRSYDAKDIIILKGLEGVRKRPAMYIGSTGKEGWHHLLWEVVDNSIDEIMAGGCTSINISLNKEGSITIEDNGRGIPVEMHADFKRPTLEVMITHLHAGGKFKKDSYQISGGLHGVGLSVVAALSEWMYVEVFRNGTYNVQKFGQGKKLNELRTHPIEEYQQTSAFARAERLNIAKRNFSNANGHSNGEGNGDEEEDISFQFELGIENNHHGTRITFLPDITIFPALVEEEYVFDFNVINNRLRELAYLNPVVEIQIYDEITKKYDDHHYEGGASEFVSYLNSGNKVLFEEPIFIHKTEDDVEVEIALQYNYTYLEHIISFVNNVSTPEGGTHVTGFKSSLTRTINNYLTKYPSKKLTGQNFSGTDVREGLTAIISVKVPEPQFEGQTKSKLGNVEVQGIVSSIITDELGKYLEENPGTSKLILDKCLLAQKARVASKNARDATRRKSALDSGRLPGKLADCSSKKAEDSELFIVEGPSAGGSAKQGRNREIQAILPLRGKILNVEKARPLKITENAEIRAMISAIGTGTYTSEESGFDIEKLRYHKIIIMCDADIDGAHIKTLLLTFFFRYLRPLVENGNIYVAVPPLYLVSYKKTKKYIYEEKLLTPYLNELKEKYQLDDTETIKVQRFKGLGEMNPEELWETTMDPTERILIKIGYNDFTETHQLFNTLMGEEVLPRKKFIMEHYKNVQNLDI